MIFDLVSIVAFPFTIKNVGDFYRSAKYFGRSAKSPSEILEGCYMFVICLFIFIEHYKYYFRFNRDFNCVISI